VVGAAGLTVNLALWTIISVQTVAQAAPPSSSSLPSFIKTIFRSIQAIQLQGIVLPPACTGEYAFAAEVTVMSLALAAALVVVAARSAASLVPTARFPQLIGRASFMLALVLFPATTRNAVSMLYCQKVRRCVIECETSLAY
jgi:hypothetical protein